MTSTHLIVLHLVTVTIYRDLPIILEHNGSLKALSIMPA